MPFHCHCSAALHLVHQRKVNKVTLLIGENYHFLEKDKTERKDQNKEKAKGKKKSETRRKIDIIKIAC